jgi:hypothetical protein
MRLLKIVAPALLASLWLVPTQASAGPAYACQVAEVFECTPAAGCRKASAAEANLPPTVTLKVKQGVFGGLFGGENNGDTYEDQSVLILHGRKDLLTWTAVVDKSTGQMSGSISSLGRTYAQFGQCTPLKE